MGDGIKARGDHHGAKIAQCSLSQTFVSVYAMALSLFPLEESDITSDGIRS